MALTFKTPNGGNSAMTGNRNKNNNAKATAKTSTFKRVGSGHPGANAPAKVTKKVTVKKKKATPKAVVKVKKAAPVVQKPKAKVTQGSPHERNTEENVTRAIGEIISSAVSTGLLGGTNQTPVSEIVPTQISNPILQGGSPHERNVDSLFTQLNPPAPSITLGSTSPVSNVPGVDLSGVDLGLQNALKGQGALGTGQADILKAISNVPGVDLSGVDLGLQNALKGQGLLGSGQEGINKGIGGLGLQLGDATLGLGNQIGGLGDQFNTGLGDLNTGLGKGQENIGLQVEGLGEQFNTGLGDLNTGLGKGQENIGLQVEGLGDQFNTGLGDLSTGLGKGQENIGLQVEGLGEQFKTYGQENVDKLTGIEDLISGLQKNSSDSDTELASSITGAVGKFKTDVEGLVGGIGDSIAGIGDSISGMNDPIKEMLEFSKRGGIFGNIFRKFNEQRKFGMNDDAKAEYANLANSPDNQHPNSKWNLMTEEERVNLARKPQMDNQLAHAFIDGHPTTPDQRAIAALTGGKAPGSSVYNADGTVNIQATAALVNQGGGNGGQGGQQAPASPKWWESGYQPPVVGGQPPQFGTPQPPQFGGGQQVPGLPDYLQREMAYTPDFTGSFQPSLLGNTTLPSQQITGLLAPPQQQQQQIDPQQLAGLLRGLR